MLNITKCCDSRALIFERVEQYVMLNVTLASLASLEAAYLASGEACF